MLPPDKDKQPKMPQKYEANVKQYDKKTKNDAFKLLQYGCFLDWLYGDSNSHTPAPMLAKCKVERLSLLTYALEWSEKNCFFNFN